MRLKSIVQQPTLTRQCWLFAVGSVLFAAATARGFPVAAGAGAANLLCFVGSWFFTAAAWMQLLLTDPGARLQWLSAGSQFAGTVLFNISTGAALVLHRVPARRHLVWTPDAAGSLAFLVSGALAVAALGVAAASRDRAIAWINLTGCVAFGVSAAAAFVRGSGATEDQWLANLGTFIGALCFLTAALLALPRFRKPGGALRQSPA